MANVASSANTAYVGTISFVSGRTSSWNGAQKALAIEFSSRNEYSFSVMKFDSENH